MAIDVAADGPTLVLRLSDWEPNESIYRRVARSNEGINKGVDAGFEVVDVDQRVNMTLTVNLQGLGISVIDKTPVELLYLSADKIELTLRDTTLYQSLGLRIAWFQVCF